MRIYALPSAVLDRFESSGVTMDFLPAAAESATTRVTVARIGPGGTLGAHAATLTQAFAVIEGDGHVAVAEGDPWRVGPGMVVVWEVGEVHTTQAATAMLAVIVETSGRLELPEHYRPLARPGGLCRSSRNRRILGAASPGSQQGLVARFSRSWPALVSRRWSGASSGLRRACQAGNRDVERTCGRRAEIRMEPVLAEHP